MNLLSYFKVKRFSVLAFLWVCLVGGMNTALADETCMSPYMAKIVGQ
jgi:hypothetical protein